MVPPPRAETTSHTKLLHCKKVDSSAFSPSAVGLSVRQYALRRDPLQLSAQLRPRRLVGSVVLDAQRVNLRYRRGRCLILHSARRENSPRISPGVSATFPHPQLKAHTI